MSSTTLSATIPVHTGLGDTVATVVAATDGTEQADGALRIAIARAKERHSRLEVLTVSTGQPLVSSETSFSVWSEGNLLRHKVLRESVEAQLHRVTGERKPYPVTLLDGNPAFTIARVAIEHHAALIVVGIGRHRVTDRLFSEETALQLARISRVPVLAVPAIATAVPQHAVVAVDFSDLSLRAAQAAVEAVGDEGRVDLVHAMPYVYEGAFSMESKDPYERWAEEQLAALAAKVVAPVGVQVICAAVRGRPAVALLDYVKDVSADVIVTGTHGRGFVSRTLVGSVTTQLLRGATCAILTIPRNPLPSLASLHEHAGAPAPEEDWVALLAEFTRRNVGRRTILEVDDLEIGAQAQEHNYPLIATVYDLRDQRLQIMLGERTAEGRHLSRSIGGVVKVGLLTDDRGHDTALRIEHGHSQTLLTFAS